MKPVVLQLIDSFYQGGSERQALQLTRLLLDSGRYDVRLACLNPEGELRTEIQDLPVGKIPAFPLTAFYNLNAFSQLRRFKQYLRANDVQVLHTHDFYTNVFGMFGAALARVPARVASMRETRGMRTKAQKHLQRTAYKFASQVVANSESVKSELLRQGLPEKKISVIYNGINADRVAVSATRSRSESLAVLNLTQADCAFVTLVANMRLEVKDYPMFLRAAQLIRTALPNVEFLLAGEGPLMPRLKEMAQELRIYDCTHFLGRCEAIADLLNISDVCVLSSKAEGFSNSILEYMAAARPVVATNVGGAAEAIIEGRTGHLVPSGDHELMAERIIGLLNRDDRADVGLAGREVVAEKFSPEAQLKRTEDLYDRLLAQAQSFSQPNIVAKEADGRHVEQS